VLHLKRPKEPPEFSTTVKKARDNLINKAGKDLSEEDFPKLWGEFKRHWSKAQFGKCGYCECQISGFQHGDIDHFRPKAGLHGLPKDRRHLGKEDPDLTSAEGRKLDRLCDKGYWWLAYEWSNYVLSCQSCNQIWKKCLFPVGEVVRPIPPVHGGHETPLLINPFDGPRPSEHLRFDELGSVEPRSDSPFGRATIDTCGLDRETLRRARAVRARQAMTQSVRLLKLPDGPAGLHDAREIIVELRRLGADDEPHAGMVRAIVEEVTSCSWEDLDDLL